MNHPLFFSEKKKIREFKFLIHHNIHTEALQLLCELSLELRILLVALPMIYINYGLCYLLSGSLSEF